MSSQPLPDPVIAYETQARYAPGEDWITLDVSISRAVAVDEAFFRSDPWGRMPTAVRVRSVLHGPRSDL